MPYYVTVYHKDNTAYEKREPFDNVDAAISFLYERRFCFPSDLQRSNAHASIDKHGLRHLVISPASAGLMHIPETTKHIFIRREDAYLVCQIFAAKDNTQQ